MATHESTLHKTHQMLEPTKRSQLRIKVIVIQPKPRRQITTSSCYQKKKDKKKVNWASAETTHVV